MPDFGPLGNELVSSAVIGIITWAGGHLLHRVKAQPANPSVDFRLAALHIAVLQFALNVVGLFLGIIVGILFGGTVNAALFDLLILFPVGTLLLAAGFFVIGMTVKRRFRWQHLLYVALGEMLATLVVNSLLGAGPKTALQLVVAVIVAATQTFTALGLGGGLTWLLKRNDPRDLQESGVPVPMMAWRSPQSQGMPYGYGAPPSRPSYQPGPPSGPWYPPGGPQYPPYPPASPSGPVYPQHPGMMPPHAPPHAPYAPDQLPHPPQSHAAPPGAPHGEHGTPGGRFAPPEPGWHPPANG